MVREIPVDTAALNKIMGELSRPGETAVWNLKTGETYNLACVDVQPYRRTTRARVGCGYCFAAGVQIGVLKPYATINILQHMQTCGHRPQADDGQASTVRAALPSRKPLSLLSFAVPFFARRLRQRRRSRWMLMSRRYSPFAQT